MKYDYIGFTTDCPHALHDDIFETFGIKVDQLIKYGDDNTTIYLERALSVGEKTTLDGIISTWECPIEDVIEEVTFNTTTGLAGQVPIWDGNKFVGGIPSGNSMIPVPFGYEGNAKNKWLPQYGKGNKSSNESPFIVPFDMIVKSITLVVEKHNADTDIQIWKADKDDDMDNATQVHMEEVRDARSRVISGVNLQFTSGDKIAIYLKDRGTDAKGPVVTLWCTATDTSHSTFTDNFDKDA